MQQYNDVMRAYINGDKTALQDLAEASQEFRQIANHPVYIRLRDVVDGFYHAAAEMALETPERAEFLKGLREGIKMFHTLIQTEVQKYTSAQEALLQLTDKEDNNREPTEPSPLTFGQSML